MKVALAYARFGWPVFPVGPDCRTPMIKGGCHSATTDPAKIADMFSAPRNYALATGHGVFVLDVDRKGADGFATLRDLEALHGPLPLTPEVSTPSGGAHLYFKQPEIEIRNRVGFAPGLDVRTKGGSVCLPPSRRSDGAYVWKRSPRGCEPPEAPGWLIGLIAPPEPVRARPTPLRLSSVDRATRYVVAAVDGECGDLAGMGPNSGRNMRLFQASARLGELVGGGLLPEDAATCALERAAQECGLVGEDGWLAVRATIASGLKRGVASPRSVEGAR